MGETPFFDDSKKRHQVRMSTQITKSHMSNDFNHMIKPLTLSMNPIAMT